MAKFSPQAFQRIESFVNKVYDVNKSLPNWTPYCPSCLKVELEQAVEDFRREEQAVAKLKAELEVRKQVFRGEREFPLSLSFNS